MDPLLERLALDQVHPEADPPVVPVGAVDHHDVGVSDANELAGLVQNLCGDSRAATSGLRSFSARG